MIATVLVIAMSGYLKMQCNFDNKPVAGDYFAASEKVIGDCTDLGAYYKFIPRAIYGCVDGTRHSECMDKLFPKKP